ncbi:hypothetical protein IE81DRAFT_329923 [Ceraceosorus guamensis]|uniref:Uncharacterized protein n=1 Tax=Ceraceosorus guamensis TaxID=1522189 RepID=A0A316VZ28_9BASI|nr:hypothetical protein IE81DRAFT_329923 [Ceraceosorus guamensis]PWN42917.1 hypothetical protein IE81DRAFT_329923 [Ceraceosorus guamensis]
MTAAFRIKAALRVHRIVPAAHVLHPLSDTSTACVREEQQQQGNGAPADPSFTPEEDRAQQRWTIVSVRVANARCSSVCLPAAKKGTSRLNSDNLAKIKMRLTFHPASAVGGAFSRLLSHSIVIFGRRDFGYLYRHCNCFSSLATDFFFSDGKDACPSQSTHDTTVTSAGSRAVVAVVQVLSGHMYRYLYLTARSLSIANISRASSRMHGPEDAPHGHARRTYSLELLLDTQQSPDPQRSRFFGVAPVGIAWLGARTPLLVQGISQMIRIIACRTLVALLGRALLIAIRVGPTWLIQSSEARQARQARPP